jgi:hypothetical protein
MLKPATNPSELSDHNLCQHVKAKSPLTREYVVPEVGLELHSLPRKHWAPPETCGIRPVPTHIRPDPKPKVWTLSTRQFRRFKAFRPTTAPRIDGARSFFALTSIGVQELFTRVCKLASLEA